MTTKAALIADDVRNVKEPGIYKKEKKYEGQSYSECGIVWELKKQFVFHLNIKRQNG